MAHMYQHSYTQTQKNVTKNSLTETLNKLKSYGSLLVKEKTKKVAVIGSLPTFTDLPQVTFLSL